ncbi:hypothetical protein SATMO3_19850 [Sporomusa aerivorans]
MRKVLGTAAIGHYSQLTEGFVFTSGQLPIDV